MERLTTAVTVDARTLVHRFERAVLTQKEWNHRAHLTVVAWYVLHYPEAEATSKMVSGILRFNRALGIEQTPTGGYHETLTLFWLAIARRFLLGLPEPTRTLDKIDRFVETYAFRKDLYLDYYSHERMWSWRARHAWVEPDLKNLP